MRVLIAVAAVALSVALAPADDKKKVEVSEEMKGFMKLLDGTEKGTAAAVKKYAADKADTFDIDGFLVREPAVTKAETKDGETTYTMAAKTGILERECLVTWKDKKITKVKQLSMK